MLDARTLMRYKAWANDVFFRAVAALPSAEAIKPRRSIFKNMVHTLNHSYVIDRIFQAHLEGRAHGYTARNTESHPPLEELWSAQRSVDQWYVDWSEAASEATLAEEVRFEFVGGGAGRMSRGAILQHLVIHAAYHRGFVAQMLFEVPNTRPPVTDLTVFLREKMGSDPISSRNGV